MKVIILSAGQGRRLLPWTHDLPKCLLPFADRPLIAWQLAALAESAVDDVVVVTGFGAHEVERALGRHTPAGLRVRTLFNPFFGVADNVASCWAAREHFHGEVALLNGDTLIEPALLAHAAGQAEAPVSVAIDTKAAYDADDVKVTLKDGKVVRIGKTLTHACAHAEAVGLTLFTGLGGPLFAAAIEAVMHRPRGVARRYLSALDDLAKRGAVTAASVAGLAWTEVDYPGDLGRAEMLARGWRHGESRRSTATGLACPVM